MYKLIGVAVLLLVVLAVFLSLWLSSNRDADSILCNVCQEVKRKPKQGGEVCDECGLARYGGRDWDD